MNRTRTAGQEVVRYPVASDCAVFIGFGKRWVERLLAITVKRYERANQSHAQQSRKKEPFHDWAGPTHVPSVIPFAWRPVMIVEIRRRDSRWLVSRYDWVKMET